MALCRIKNAEQLKQHPPGELGKLLGLDRVPEVGSFRRKLKQVIDQGKSEELHTALYQSWISEMPEMVFYIDGHVRVYHGKKAKLAKRYVSREKLCLHGTTEFWVNDQNGMPVMVITAELNEKLKEAIEIAIVKLKKEIKAKENQAENTPLFTMIFDRESYEPSWFKKLWEEHKVAIITYRKNIKDNWNENWFESKDIQVLGNDVTMLLCEKEIAIKDQWFREIRRLTPSGHQTSILTTHPLLIMDHIAVKMFSRWTQENFFKYLIENYDFDKMIEYGTQPCLYKKTIPNPKYRKLTYDLKKLKEKKARIEAKAYQKIHEQPNATIEELESKMSRASELIEQINSYDQEIRILKQNRKGIMSRITIDQMPENERYDKLKTESKKFKNAIIMIAYRAETSLYNIIKSFYKGHQNDGRMLVKKIMTSEADMTPDHINQTLTITLHSLATPRDNEAANKLCQLLTDSQAIYPGTNMRLIYKTVATQTTKGLVVCIYKIDECMPRYVTDESINAVKYFVAADNLKSITIGQGGSITHPLKPYGAYDDGRPAYKKHELEKQTFRYDEITINIIDNGFINIIAEGQKMNMNFLSIKSQSRLGRRLNNTQSAISYSRSQLGIQVLYGKTNELNINKIETRFILNAQNFQANNVTLKQNKK